MALAVDSVVCGAVVWVVTEFLDEFAFKQVYALLLLAGELLVQFIFQGFDELFAAILRQIILREEFIKIPIQVIQIDPELSIDIVRRWFFDRRIKYRNKSKNRRYLDFLFISSVGMSLQIVILDFIVQRVDKFRGVIPKVDDVVGRVDPPLDQQILLGLIQLINHFANHILTVISRLPARLTINPIHPKAVFIIERR